MSLIFSPLMLTSSRMTSTVFQMMQRRKNLKRKNIVNGLYCIFVVIFCVFFLNWSVLILVDAESYFFALRGVMLNGGPGGPKDLGNKSTHIIRRPWWTTSRPSWWSRRYIGNKMNNAEIFWRTNETWREEKAVTCSMSGCSGLYSGLVSTCSGTNPIFLKMWRDSCSLIGPRWRLETFLSSKEKKKNRNECAFPISGKLYLFIHWVFLSNIEKKTQSGLLSK